MKLGVLMLALLGCEKADSPTLKPVRIEPAAAIVTLIDPGRCQERVSVTGEGHCFQNELVVQPVSR